MRRAKPVLGQDAQGYRRFAGIVVTIAALVAVAANDPTPPVQSMPDAGKPADMAQARPRPDKTLAKRTQPLFPDQTETDLTEPDPDSATAATAKPVRPEPSMPGQPARPASSAIRQAEVRPSPAQLDNLIAGSRARSGGVDQGDEPRRIT